MLKKIWQSAIQLGITEDLDSREARQISSVNRITMVAILYTLVRALISIPNYSYSLKLLTVACLGAIILLLNHKHLYLSAKILILAIWITGGCLFSFLYLGGFKAGSYVFLFSCIPMIFMIFGVKNKLHIIMSLLYFFTCFCLLIILSYTNPLPAIANIDLEVVRLSTTILTIILLLFISWSFHSSSERAEDKLITTKIELEKALDEISSLEGIIPMCSYCNSIRNDKGAWDRMEKYLSKHSDAVISHGICPKCLPKVRSEAGIDKK